MRWPRWRRRQPPRVSYRVERRRATAPVPWLPAVLAQEGAAALAALAVAAWLGSYYRLDRSGTKRRNRRSAQGVTCASAAQEPQTRREQRRCHRTQETKAGRSAVAAEAANIGMLGTSGSPWRTVAVVEAGAVLTEAPLKSARRAGSAEAVADTMAPVLDARRRRLRRVKPRTDFAVST